MAPTIEICVDNFESIQQAVKGGAKRIELCSSLLDGGLTPSIGLMQMVRKTFPDLIVFPMIRPRGGDFNYSQCELEIMANDIEYLKNNGANGFVFGCLTVDGSIDMNANRFLLEKAQPFPCTFHRAFDMVANVEQSLEDVIKLGFRRILTSGQAANALEGLSNIEKLIKLSSNRIIIMPGCGINVDNLSKILMATKCQEFHCSASIKRQSSMIYRNDHISMGKNDSNNNEYQWKICDSNLVKQMIEIASKI